MGIFTTEVELDKEEQLIKEVIEAILVQPATIIDVEPENMEYLVSNEEHSYYIIVDSVGIKLRNHDFAIDRQLKSKVIDVYKTLVKKEKTKRWMQKQEKIFTNSVNLLERIKENLNQA